MYIFCQNRNSRLADISICQVIYQKANLKQICCACFWPKLSVLLAFRWTGRPCVLQSMGSERVRRNWTESSWFSFFFFLSYIHREGWVFKWILFSHQGTIIREFTGSPVVRTWCLHCWGYEFNPWLGNLRSQRPQSTAKKRRNHYQNKVPL